jgi:cytochrome c553
VPVLHGRTPDQIAEAMREFREGRRAATVMDRIARGFTDDEARAIAAAVVVAPEAKAP